MSFREVIDTAQCVALSNKLYQDEIAVYERTCREYSKRFHTELVKVFELDFEFVARQLFGDVLETWNTEEQMEDFVDLWGSLNDPNYDANKERALKEEDRRILEEEEARVRNKEAVHVSLEKDKKPKENKKELPKSGGINMSLINQLQNEEQETGQF